MEKKAMNFSSVNEPKLEPILRFTCLEFIRQAEESFVKALQAEQIGEELESQELCLLKQDFLSDLDAEK